MLFLSILIIVSALGVGAFSPDITRRLLTRNTAVNRFVLMSSASTMSIPSIASSKVGSVLKTPDSIARMMEEVALGIMNAQSDQIPLTRVEVPLPVTGGTELDDWPGGIRQKYATLRPMLLETMKALNFTKQEMEERKFVEGGEDDAVGIWESARAGVQLVSFPDPDSIEPIRKYMKWSSVSTSNNEAMTSNEDAHSEEAAMAEDVSVRSDGPLSTTLSMINHQLFLDPLSKQDSKDFLASAVVAYQLENLNMRGPGALPVRGLVYRIYPYPFQVARRLDQGGYEVIAVYEQLPAREELEKVFYEDSEVRDKNLSLIDRLKRQVPNFGS